MGLLLIVRGYWLAHLFLTSTPLKQRAARHVDRAVQSVGITLRKNKSDGRAIQKAHTRDK